MKKILNRAIYIWFAGLVFLPEVSAEQQNYIGVLTSNDVRVDPISYVDWGCVDEDKIELYNIPDDNDGYIDFVIDNTTDVEVSLVSEDDPTIYFGFKFTENTFDIIVQGILESYNPSSGPTNSYNPTTEFKVEKCDNKIFYYKNGVLIYSFCADNGDKIGPLFHLTEVIAASNSDIDLLFESESLNCVSNILSQSDEVALLRGESEDENASEESNLLTQGYQPNSTVLVNVYSSTGRPVKQYRKTTNQKGIIQNSDEILKFLKKRDYKIQIRLEK